MTHTTEQERAEFEKAWRERPIYMGGVHQKEVAYIWWTQAARRAPVAQVPHGLREAAQAVVERWDTPLWKDVPATAVYIADLRAALAAAPQPPEAAPMQLPEPFTSLVRKKSWSPNCYEASPLSEAKNYGRQWADERINVYTEHQVLTILAQHGIKTT